MECFKYRFIFFEKQKLLEDKLLLYVLISISYKFKLQLVIKMYTAYAKFFLLNFSKQKVSNRSAVK